MFADASSSFLIRVHSFLMILRVLGCLMNLNWMETLSSSEGAEFPARGSQVAADVSESADISDGRSKLFFFLLMIFNLKGRCLW